MSPADASYPQVVRGLDASIPAQAAVLRLASVLFRGAGYVAFDGAPPTQDVHSAVAAPYAHATAPLRRLADRYVSECSLAACADRPVPDWVRAALPTLPRVMAEADQRAHAADRAVVDATEAWLLHDRVGTVFSAVVIDADDHGGTVVLDEPAVRARCAGTNLPVGERIRVRLATADVVTRKVAFEPAP